MIGVRWLVKDDEAKAMLQRAEKKMQNPENALNQIGGVGLRSIAKTFEAGGRPEKWKPSIRAEQTGGKTLLKSARLLRSITFSIGKRMVTWGTSAKYARIHQLGGEVKPKSAKALKINIPGVGWRTLKSVKIPARKFLVMQGEDIRAFERIIAEDVTS